MHAHEASLGILLLLGAAHGLNPAMGWLFAVSLGLQEQRRRAVWGAFAPLALGHGIAIGVALAGAAVVGVVLPVSVLKWIVAVGLVGMGLLQLRGHWHPRRGGMRVNAKDLTLWSFLMASAHGAGLMTLPFLLSDDASATDIAGAHAAGPSGPGHPAAHLLTNPGPEGEVVSAGITAVDSAALMGTAAHTLGYLLVALAIAVLVYEKLGLRLLRTAWVNVNLIWAAALIVTGLLTPLL